MMTSEDIKGVTFEKSMRGYRVDDVDDFLQTAAASMEEIAAERDTIMAEKEIVIEEKMAIESKIMILAHKVDEYRGQEDTLKTALINAQRMGETVVHEAKQKADAIMRDATGKAELLRQQAEQEIAHEKYTLEMLQNEVSRFKATVLNFYKQHIESMSALDAPAERAATVLKELEDKKNDETSIDDDNSDDDLIIVQGKETQSFRQSEVEIPDDNIEVLQAAKVSVEAKPDAGKSVNLFEGVPLGNQ